MLTEEGWQWELIRWGVLSAVSFGVNLGLTIFLRERIGIAAPTAFAVALLLVVVANFLGLKYFVLAIADGPVWEQASRFLSLTLFFRSGEWALFAILHSLGAADYRVLLVAVLAVSSLTKFTFYREALRATRSTLLPGGESTETRRGQRRR